MLNLPDISHFIFRGHFFSKLWCFGAREAVPRRFLVLCKIKATVSVCPLLSSDSSIGLRKRKVYSHLMQLYHYTRPYFCGCISQFFLDPAPRTVYLSEVVPGS